MAATPLIPLVRLRGTLRHITRTGRSDLLPGLLGPLLPMLPAGAVGEMLGYLLGPGRSAERKVPAELHRAELLAAGDRRPATG